MSKPHIDCVKRPTTDSREKDNKGNQRLTVHIRPKPAHLIAPLGHFDHQVPNLFLALTDLAVSLVAMPSTTTFRSLSP